MEETQALIPEENVLTEMEKPWISVRQLSVGFGTMLLRGQWPRQERRKKAANKAVL
jgi:hypothetical protein